MVATYPFTITTEAVRCMLTCHAQYSLDCISLTVKLLLLELSWVFQHLESWVVSQDESMCVNCIDGAAAHA